MVILILMIILVMRLSYYHYSSEMEDYQFSLVRRLKISIAFHVEMCKGLGPSHSG